MRHWIQFLAVLVCVLGASIGAAHAQDYWSSRWGTRNAATAADTGLYVGAGYVRAQVNNIYGTTGGYDFKIDDNAYKAIVGFRPIPPFAVEANYVNLGHQSSDLLGGGFNPYSHRDSRAFDIFGVGLLPLGPVDIFGKAGGARWTLSSDAQGPNSTLFALNRSGTSFAWGAGVQAHWGPLGGRLEYEHFQMPYTDGARLFSADVTFTF
jgi:hypothetical protein